VSLFPKRKNGTLLLDERDFSSRLRKITGFRTSNLRIYEAAFIHRSASFSLPDGKRINNERLEFLGDAVLDAILSDYLFEKFPDAAEGFMTKIRSRIVNREVLNQLSVSMGLDKLLVSNVSTNHTTRNLYGDALEALIGALFIDKGFNKTKKLFISRVFNIYLQIDEIVKTDTDYKSLVFEWYIVWVLLELLVTPPGLFLLVARSWKNFPMHDRVDVAYGYLATSWIGWFAFGLQTGSDPRNWVNFFDIGLFVTLIIVAYGALIALSYWLLRRTEKIKPEEMFP